MQQVDLVLRSHILYSSLRSDIRASQARQLLVHCIPHVVENVRDLRLEEYYFANGIYTDVWRGSLGSRTVAVKVWRGVALAAHSREPFVIVSHK
jgi:hypothetical protein